MGVSSMLLPKIESAEPDIELIHFPLISGYQWISSTQGDFAIGNQLIMEVTARRGRGRLIVESAETT